MNKLPQRIFARENINTVLGVIGTLSGLIALVLNWQHFQQTEESFFIGVQLEAVGYPTVIERSAIDGVSGTIRTRWKVSIVNTSSSDAAIVGLKVLFSLGGSIFDDGRLFCP